MLLVDFDLIWCDYWFDERRLSNDFTWNFIHIITIVVIVNFIIVIWFRIFEAPRGVWFEYLLTVIFCN